MFDRIRPAACSHRPSFTCWPKYLRRSYGWPTSTTRTHGVAYLLSLLLTGGFHEDGLADTADALGGASDREQLFVILKDSRVGSYGATALAATMLLRVTLLAESGSLGWIASGSFAGAPGNRHQCACDRIRGCQSQHLGPGGVMALASALTGGSLVLGWLFDRRAGGITGDFLGATEQACEVITLAVLVVAWR